MSDNREFVRLPNGQVVRVTPEQKEQLRKNLEDYYNAKDPEQKAEILNAIYLTLGVAGATYGFEKLTEKGIPYLGDQLGLGSTTSGAGAAGTAGAAGAEAGAIEGAMGLAPAGGEAGAAGAGAAGAEAGAGSLAGVALPIIAAAIALQRTYDSGGGRDILKGKADSNDWGRLGVAASTFGLGNDVLDVLGINPFHGARTKVEGDRWKKLASKLIEDGLDPRLIPNYDPNDSDFGFKDESRTRGEQYKDLALEHNLTPESEAGFYGENKDKWINPQWLLTGDKNTLKPEDVWGYSAFTEKFGPEWLNKYTEEQRRNAAQYFLDKGLINEHHGTIDLGELDEEKKKELEDILHPVNLSLEGV